MKYQKGFEDGNVLILVIVVAIVLLFCVVFSIDRYACESRAKGLGLESDWGPVQGCLVKVGNRYAPIEYIRITDDEKIIISGDGE